MLNRNIPPSPVYYLSAMIVLALDWIWSLFEGMVSLTLIGMIALPVLSAIIFVVAFVSVYSIQYFVAHDTGGQAFAKGIGMAVLAAVPFPVMGTAIGVPLLAWAGLNQLTSGADDVE